MDRDGGEGPAQWSRAADEHDERMPRIGPYPIAGLVQRARRIANLSQRELARRAGLSPSTVGRVESGAIRPTLDALQRMLACAGLHLVVVDADGRVVQPMRVIDDAGDGTNRRYPAHLDTILDPRPGQWWVDQHGLARPPETCDARER